MTNVVGVVQVRMGSSRLPGKVMAAIEGHPMTWHIVNRLRHARLLNNVVIAVADGQSDEPIRRMARDESIPYFAGSEADLIDRVYRTALEFHADAIVRITGDSPLVDPDVVDLLVKVYSDRSAELDYVSNGRPPTFPYGLNAEVYPTATLQSLWHQIKDPLYREWFPVYVWEHEDAFRTYNVVHSEDLSHLRWTVDYDEDLSFVRQVYDRLYTEGKVFRMIDVLRLLASEPHLAKINAEHQHRTEGNLKATATHPMTARTCEREIKR